MAGYDGALSVKCPWCGAVSGVPCRDKFNGAGLTWVHQSRVRAYRKSCEELPPKPVERFTVGDIVRTAAGAALEERGHLPRRNTRHKVEHIARGPQDAPIYVLSNARAYMDHELEPVEAKPELGDEERRRTLACRILSQYGLRVSAAQVTRETLSDLEAYGALCFRLGEESWAGRAS